MTARLDKRVKPAYRLLTEAQANHLHRATLTVLGKTGVRVGHEEGLQLLRQAGCRVRTSL